MGDWTLEILRMLLDGMSPSQIRKEHPEIDEEDWKSLGKDCLYWKSVLDQIRGGAGDEVEVPKIEPGFEVHMGKLCELLDQQNGILRTLVDACKVKGRQGRSIRGTASRPVPESPAPKKSPLTPDEAPGARSGKRWTEYEEKRLRRMLEEKVSIPEMAERLKRTQKSIRYRMSFKHHTDPDEYEQGTQ